MMDTMPLKTNFQSCVHDGSVRHLSYTPIKSEHTIVYILLDTVLAKWKQAWIGRSAPITSEK
jgi:hypothetical protein